MRADLIGQLDDGGNAAYLLGVDGDFQALGVASKPSTSVARSGRRPRSSLVQRESIARLAPYSYANSDKAREIREARQE